MAPAPMPSDELCAAVTKTADACWHNMVDNEALAYERSRLPDLGVRVPPHTLHDYSLSGTRVVVEAIKLRRDTLIRLQVDRRWPFADVTLGPSAMWHLAPVFGALQVEQGRLDRLERRAA